MKLKNLVAAMQALACPAIIPIPAQQTIGIDQDPQNYAATLAGIGSNGQSVAGEFGFSASSGTSGTITALGGAVFQWTAGSATTVTIDSAYNIGLTLPQPLRVGQVFGFQMMTTSGTTIATPTLLATDVTLAGTTSMLASALRWYRGAITQVSTLTTATATAGTTFTSLTQVGSSNLFTVALSGNSISPTVGTLLHLTGITGTLPAGWYPIVKVTSATSFVIATPPGTVWTATAATVDVAGTQPSAPVYAPTMTITGIMTIGANAAV